MRTHISNFGIENFRVFKDHTHFEFAPITVLVGPNGSGKTSLMSAFRIVKDYFPNDLAKLFHDQIGDKKLIDKIGLIKDNIAKKIDDNHITISIDVAPSFISNPLKANISLAIQKDALELAKVDSIAFKDDEEDIVFEITSDGKSDTGYAIANFTLLHQYYKEEFLRANRINESKKEDIEFLYGSKTGHQILDKSYFGLYRLQQIFFGNREKVELLRWDPKKNGYCFDYSQLREFSVLLESNTPPVIHSEELATKGDQAICNILSAQKIEVQLGEFGVLKKGNSIKFNFVELGDFSLLEKVFSFFGFNRTSLTDEIGNFYDQKLVSLYSPTRVNFANLLEDSNDIENSLLFQKYQLILSKISDSCKRINIIDHEVIQVVALLILYRLEFDLYCERKQLSSNEAIALYKGENLNTGKKEGNKTLIGYIELYLQALSNEIANFSKLKGDLSAIQKAEARRRLSIHDESILTDGIAEYINSVNEPWKQKELESALSFAIQLFGFGEELKIDTSRGEFAIWIKRNEDTFINLADCGLGIRRLVELLFQLLPKGIKFDDIPPQVIHLEEPEANLHPAFQSKLADLMVFISQIFNTQFIIETHSEYLIRKLQYLTAKKEIKPEDTVIYYFYPPDDVPPGEEQVKKINIDVDGYLTGDFGTGFFDESDKIAMSIWNMNKSQKN